MDIQDKPTKKFYGLFQYIFDFYNDELFDNQIKDCLIVITRKKNVAGHYAFKRWYHNENLETDELALNPSMFLKFPLIEICQTVVHEMAHGWQFHYGTPSRPGYHNKEWSDKMIDLGLMPSSTGQVGGKTVGQAMSDYPINDGKFLEATEELLNSDIFSGLFLEINPDIAELINPDTPLFDQIKDLTLADHESKPKKLTKIKYSCGCSNVWGKPDLDINCNACGTLMFPN
ncbi:SprT-like family protein [Mariniflexile fucanivorans]|uniref:SprT-like family protein n=1 Tax=Mariniflexile fucanivorans TaxID=264023 RepID=A0A4R1R9X7_9FLAO|nr:SprT-like domain-containing protein [Mariniflexile fucanivorans]TCL62505.1 SprT-like family protein [Mariniflexile fucanivorans]